MSNSKQETIADIVAWLRRPREGENAYLTLERNEIADRIEAAEKQSVTNCNHLGNAAKIREALENIAEYAKAAACHTEDAHLLGYLNQIERWAEDALSSPPRNCDVLSDKQEALAAIHEDRGYVNNPIDERRLTVKWLFAEAKGVEDEVSAK